MNDLHTLQSFSFARTSAAVSGGKQSNDDSDFAVGCDLGDLDASAKTNKAVVAPIRISMEEFNSNNNSSTNTNRNLIANGRNNSADALKTMNTDEMSDNNNNSSKVATSYDNARTSFMLRKQTDANTSTNTNTNTNAILPSTSGITTANTLTMRERNVYDKIAPYIQDKVISTKTIYEIMWFAKVSEEEFHSVITKLPHLHIVKKLCY